MEIFPEAKHTYRKSAPENVLQVWDFYNFALATQ